MSPIEAQTTSQQGQRRWYVFVTAAVALAAVTGCSTLDAKPAARTAYGAAQPLGNGTARVFVMLDDHKRPTSIGVAMTEAAMTNLPMTPLAPSPSAATLSLALPAEARVTGFDHVMLDWNPNGHEPDHVYTHPHFDFHFYTVSEAQQMAIVPTAPRFEARASRLPDAQYTPPGYVAAHVLMKAPAPAATVPMMGLHWIDGLASELHGHMFTSTFLWGSYDGHFIFLEPMITKAYIESVKTAEGNTIAMPLNAPAKYERPGYYPSAYSITWDSARKEYRIALDGLSMR